MSPGVLLSPRASLCTNSGHGRPYLLWPRLGGHGRRGSETRLCMPWKVCDPVPRLRVYLQAGGGVRLTFGVNGEGRTWG